MKYLFDLQVVFNPLYYVSQIVEVMSGGELMSIARELDFLPGFAFEGFPNRDSTKYGELYGIPDAHTMFRGTLRYKGSSSFLC